jgi:3-hydroxybutyryl-CoA dehydrogenase
VTRPLPVVGVAGAGTIGAGIAQLAREAGARTVVYDPDPAREVERDLAALAPCGLVIEAAPEDLALKRALLRELAGVVADGCVLATNTSSLTVAAVAAEVPGPDRVVGMHFFNPAPRMRLVEVVAGPRSGERALAIATEVAAAMGKRVVRAPDGPGFLVNRCNRPFSLEALRLVEEGIASPEQVDRIVRLGGGFRMGPFALMDLVGIDVGVDVAESFWRQSYGEPRWRPSPLAKRMAASGRHGRKAGEGWFAYPQGPPPDPSRPEPGGGEGLVVVAGEGTVAAALRDAAAEVGWDVAWPDEAEGEIPALIVDCGATEADGVLQGAPQLLLCDAAPLSAQDPGGTAAGFHVLPSLGGLAELTTSPTTSATALRTAEGFFASLGLLTERVGDAPGLVLGRILAQLVNEACFALGAGVATAEDIDAGMVLGLNHPRGPLSWADEVGAESVLAILLALHEEYREERYRPAPGLVRAVRAEQPLRPTL